MSSIQTNLGFDPRPVKPIHTIGEIAWAGKATRIVRARKAVRADSLPIFPKLQTLPTLHTQLGRE